MRKRVHFNKTCAGCVTSYKKKSSMTLVMRTEVTDEVMREYKREVRVAFDIYEPSIRGERFRSWACQRMLPLFDGERNETLRELWKDGYRNDDFYTLVQAVGMALRYIGSHKFRMCMKPIEFAQYLCELKSMVVDYPEEGDDGSGMDELYHYTRKRDVHLALHLDAVVSRR